VNHEMPMGGGHEKWRNNCLDIAYIRSNENANAIIDGNV